MTGRSWFGLAIAIGLLGAAAETRAQDLGTYRWQLAPYCNTVTLQLTQANQIYRLEGYDDQCGGGVRAAVSGTAHLNPNGTLSFAVTTTRPDGLTISTSASITLPAVSGTWSDEYGNQGTFVFGAPSPSPGTVRPLSLRGNYAFSKRMVGSGDGGSVPISFGRALSVAPRATFRAVGSAPTAACPGTVDAPTAAPGNLCVYERVSQSTSTGICNSTNLCTGFADKWGAILDVVPTVNTAGAQIYTVGVWVVTP